MSERVEYVVIGLGALGSSAAYHLARRGCAVVGLEQFALGHDRGASHDTSRILRHSYHTPGYVDLTFSAYDDWAALEADADESLVTVVGGLDLFPPGGAIPLADYTGSLRAHGVEHELLEADEVQRRWPVFQPPVGTVGLYQPRAAIVPAARGTAVLQRQARGYGACLRDGSRVSRVRDQGRKGIEVVADRSYLCRRLLVCADAWTNDVLAGLDLQLPLVVTQEQVTYFGPVDPDAFGADRMPLWIWMDDPAFYGFPCYGEPTVKAAQDCGGPVVTGEDRSFTPDSGREALLVDFMAGLLPLVGPPVRSKTCLYTLPPDRDFLLGPVPEHPSVTVALGAGHGFKFAPTLGRLLAELASTGECSADVEPFRLDRPALQTAGSPTSWLI